MSTIRDARTAEEREKAFLPGMGKTWLLPFYDLFTRFGDVARLHTRAVAAAGVRSGETVLDVGCGTGNLALAVLRSAPGAEVTGADPDGAALRIAARKARRRGVRLGLVQAYADRLPGEDGSLDHVVSSLALHHVDDAGREGFAREARRLLRPGGTVTVVDFGGSEHGHGHGGDGHGGHEHGGHEHGHRHGVKRRTMENTYVSRNLDDGLVRLLREAGFEDVAEVEHIEHRFGEVTIVRATRR